MPILKILTNPNPILRKKSIEIKKSDIVSKETKKLCLDIAKTMLDKDGVGLAAPQIGKNVRLCVIYPVRNSSGIILNCNPAATESQNIISNGVNVKNKAIALINPKITKKSWARAWGEEGCLSVPNIFGEVRRHKKIICKYFNNKGKEIKISAEGLLARVIQHEVDHLDGILFIDKAKNLKEAKTPI